jgi:predicted transcriptional regulator
MKTAISMPDELFREADELARRLGKPRSQLFADAIREYLAVHDPDRITERLNELADEMNAEAGWVLENSKRVLRRVEWP